MLRHCLSSLTSVHADVLPLTDHIDVIGTEAHIRHTKSADIANKFIQQFEHECPLSSDILGDTLSKCSVATIKRDAIRCLSTSRDHCLDKCSAWFSTLLLAVDDVTSDSNNSFQCPPCHTNHGSSTQTRIYVAQDSIRQQQFDRATYFCEKLPASVPLGRYLYFYSTLLSIEKKYVDNRVKPLSASRDDTPKLKLLADDMKREEATLDSYGLYIYALVLQKLKFTDEARRVLQKSIELDPLNWSSWDELSRLIDNSKMLLSVELPDHWLKVFYVAQVLHRLQILRESLYLYCHLLLKLPRFTNVLNAIGIVCHDMQKASEGIESFLLAREIDPCSLECVDYMSNTLFLLNMKEELAVLSDWLLGIDKYRPETCIVVSNYCSIRGDHEKAVDYLERALLLDPYWQYAYVLLGHEYMELKNINAATEAYRKAIQLDNADYRSWYGLGQTYEIMKMYHFALHYFKEAHRLKPNDSRFLVAMGDCYDQLSKGTHAVSMYWQAYCCDDSERMALCKLAKTYEKDHNKERAARAYAYLIYDYTNKGWDEVELGDAYLYLARYHLDAGDYDSAITCAHKCMQYVEVKERAKAILQQITDIRKWQQVNLVDVTGAEVEPLHAGGDDMDTADSKLDPGADLMAGATTPILGATTPVLGTLGILSPHLSLPAAAAAASHLTPPVKGADRPTTGWVKRRVVSASRGSTYLFPPGAHMTTSTPEMVEHLSAEYLESPTAPPLQPPTHATTHRIQLPAQPMATPPAASTGSQPPAAAAAQPSVNTQAPPPAVAISTQPPPALPVFDQYEDITTPTLPQQQPTPTNDDHAT